MSTARSEVDGASERLKSGPFAAPPQGPGDAGHPRLRNNIKQTALMLEHACESGHPKTPAFRAQQKRSRMKQLSQSISNSTKSPPGRWTKVATLGCILALVFLGATSALPKAKGTARPFKASGIVTEFILNPDYSGSLALVGTATHLGKFDSYAYWVPNYLEDGTPDGTLHVWASFTAANGDILRAEFPEFVGASGDATITGGTGRFAGASGSYVATFSGADLEIFSVEGTISY